MMVQEPTHSSKGQDFAKLLSRGYLELAAFARLIRVSPPTAYKMQQRGEIRAVRVGKRWRVYEDEVKRFLREGNYSDGTGDIEIKPGSSVNG